MNIIDGKKQANIILEKIKDKIQRTNIKPRLDIVFIGDSPASEVYVNKKADAGKNVGVEVVVHRYHEAGDEEIQTLVNELADNTKVNGIILQLPAPGIDADAVYDLIPVIKDVDGLNPASLGCLWHQRRVLIPATAKAVMMALEEIAGAERKDLAGFFDGKNVLIMNRSVIIGKPLAAMLTNLNATVTLAHSHTKDLDELMGQSDVIISGVGKPGIISPDKLKKGVVVIDAGFVKQDKKIYGDIGSNDLSQIASYISPVPNGIGPMGVACLIDNTVTAALWQQGR